MEVPCMLQEWCDKRDSIMADPVWTNGGMWVFFFPMNSGSGIQTLLLPVAELVLHYSNLSPSQVEQVHVHECELANAPCIITMGTILDEQLLTFDTPLLFKPPLNS